jgi:hypothetical protein
VKKLALLMSFGFSLCQAQKTPTVLDVAKQFVQRLQMAEGRGDMTSACVLLDIELLFSRPGYVVTNKEELAVLSKFSVAQDGKLVMRPVWLSAFASVLGLRKAALPKVTLL